MSLTGNSAATRERQVPARRCEPRALALRLAMIGLVLAPLGCSRSYYRRQADQFTYEAIEKKTEDPRWPLYGYTIEMDPRSRLYDPNPPDCPPMPPDDPTSHEIMHCVDCKSGFPCWHNHGDLAAVDDLHWEAYLPRDVQGQMVLDMQSAVELALLNSPDYQESLEELYLSALDVTFESFRFDAQFFGGNSTFYTSDGRIRAGGVSSSILNTDTDLQMQRLFAAGGTVVVDFANSFVWQFAGPNSERVNTLLDLSFIQPLLRGAGRARVLERLTFAERSLLANVRQMERFRRGFYLEIMVGRDAGAGPRRAGGFFGGAGLEGFSGVGGGGFGVVGGFVGGGGGFGGGITGVAGAAQAQGFFGLLQNLKVIQNQEANVAGLRDSLAQLQASYEANRIDRFQVDQALQALLEAQSQLMILRASYETDVDQFLGDLGLPPTIPVRIDDPLLAGFDLVDPRVTDIQASVDELLTQLRNPVAIAGLESVEGLFADLASLRERAAAQIDIVKQDFATLENNRQTRRDSLSRISQRPEVEGGELDTLPYDVMLFDERVEKAYTDFANLLDRFDATFDQIERLPGEAAPLEREALRRRLLDTATEFSAEIGDLLLVQARARLDGIVLEPVDLGWREAVEIARANRRDWMNSRAAVVDSWRRIEFNANDLESGLDLVFNGDIANTQDDPFRFRDTTGRLSVGLEFDAPLTRVAERNVYRQSLIEYQQARRNYMQFTDAVKRGLRNELRTIELNQLNFEIRRAAVIIAISQVELTRLRLTEPPPPEVEFQLSPTTARDLVDALQDLTRVQNEFLSVWVNTEVQRMGLDFDLGTMQLDQRGLWIDPGEITAERAWSVPGAPHQQPVPDPLDLEPTHPSPEPVEPAVAQAALSDESANAPWWWPQQAPETGPLVAMPSGPVAVPAAARRGSEAAKRLPQVKGGGESVMRAVYLDMDSAQGPADAGEMREPRKLVHPPVSHDRSRGLD